MTMTLRELIGALEARPQNQPVRFDFDGMVPTVIDSWRGIYAELALGYDAASLAPSVGSLIDTLRGVNGAVLEGYKGGSFRMGLNTPVHVDNWGDYTEREIIRVDGDAMETVLVTSVAP